MTRNQPEWQKNTLSNVLDTLANNVFWRTRLTSTNINIHLSIFNPPYLDYILEGKKTVESRFSIVRCAPYGRVDVDDLLLLKQSSGPIVGVCRVDRVWSYELDPLTFDEIRDKFSGMLCADGSNFWDSRKRAQYATLMRICDATKIKPIACEKRDRRGWVILGSSPKQQEFTL